MDKRLEINNREGVLTIKTGINYYRSFTFLAFIGFATAFIFLIVFNRNIIEIIVNLVLGVVFLLLTIFMDK